MGYYTEQYEEAIKGYGLTIPRVEHLHQKVEEKTREPSGLNMGRWHTCATTHCRAGWIVQLAGEEGKKLEERLDTDIAAMLIHEASSPGVEMTAREFYVGDVLSRDLIVEAATREREIELAQAIERDAKREREGILEPTE